MCQSMALNPLSGKCLYLITWGKLRKLIYTLIHNEFLHRKLSIDVNNQKIQDSLMKKKELKIAEAQRGTPSPPPKKVQNKKIIFYLQNVQILT